MANTDTEASLALTANRVVLSSLTMMLFGLTSELGTGDMAPGFTPFKQGRRWWRDF